MSETGYPLGLQTSIRLKEVTFPKRIGRLEELSETVVLLLPERSSITSGRAHASDGVRAALPREQQRGRLKDSQPLQPSGTTSNFPTLSGSDPR